MALTTRKKRRRRGAPRRAVRRVVRRTATARRRVGKRKRSITGIAALGLLLLPAIQNFSTSGRTMAQKLAIVREQYTGFNPAGQFNINTIVQTYGPAFVPLLVFMIAKFLLGSQRIGNMFRGLPAGA